MGRISRHEHITEFVHDGVIVYIIDVLGKYNQSTIKNARHNNIQIPILLLTSKHSFISLVSNLKIFYPHLNSTHTPLTPKKPISYQKMIRKNAQSSLTEAPGPSLNPQSQHVVSSSQNSSLAPYPPVPSPPVPHSHSPSRQSSQTTVYPNHPPHNTQRSAAAAAPVVDHRRYVSRDLLPSGVVGRRTNRTRTQRYLAGCRRNPRTRR